MTEDELRAARAQLDADRKQLDADKKAFEDGKSLKKIRSTYEKQIADLTAQVKDRDDLISEIMDGGSPAQQDKGVTREELAEFTKLLRC